jgi:hypothetical protein
MTSRDDRSRLDEQGSWTIAFDHAGLTDADVRMLSAVVDGNLRIIEMMSWSADRRPLVVELAGVLSKDYPHVTFRIVRSGNV